MTPFGLQDRALVGNPNISYFVSVFKKYTNFAIAHETFKVEGSAQFGNRVSFTIDTPADCLGRLWLSVKVPSWFTPFIDSKIINDSNGYGYIVNDYGRYESVDGWIPTYDVSYSPLYYQYVNDIGNFLIESVELEIGGTVIDSHDGRYMDIAVKQETGSKKSLGFFSDALGLYDRDTYNTYYRDPVYNIVRTAAGEEVPCLTHVVAYRKTNFLPGNRGTLKIPLHFWFCKPHFAALPVAALRGKSVRVNVKFRRFEELLTRSDFRFKCDDAVLGAEYRFLNITAAGATYRVNNLQDTTLPRTYYDLSGRVSTPTLAVTSLEDLPSFGVAELIGEVYYLDDAERSRIIGDRHELVITQVQRRTYSFLPENYADLEAGYDQLSPSFSTQQPQGLVIANCDLDFNHPVTHLYWVVQRNKCAERGEHDNYSTATDYEYYRLGLPRLPPVKKAMLQVNAIDWFEQTQAGNFFQFSQNWQHSDIIPDRNNHIYTHNFSIEPAREKSGHNSHGFVNFSRMEGSRLQLWMQDYDSIYDKAYQVHIYAVNLNVIRIWKGLGGLVFMD